MNDGAAPALDPAGALALLATILTEQFELRHDDPLTGNTRLASLDLDSLAFVEFAAVIEECFSVKVKPEMFRSTPTLGALAAAVMRLRPPLDRAEIEERIRGQARVTPAADSTARSA